ncbi:MAG: TIGR03088 family PEP-CTERM/XrtA system glycosyltransferase [Burkholderiaceae bacterium]|nr:TIGR03088 family PEP-CTERM/XrtA system glycosyltransferase [Burkholderiaceae bacterium]
MTCDARPLVMHVIHHLVIGGMENGLVNLINRLPHESIRHAVVCIEDFTEFRQRIIRRDVEIVALHRSRVGAMRVRRQIYALCRRWRPDIVHARNLSGLDALLPSLLAGVPVRIQGEHGWDVDNLDGQRWKPAILRRLHSPLVTRYVTVSRDLAAFLTSRIGVNAERITTICNGVDANHFMPGAPRAALDLPPSHMPQPGRFVVGTVGRLRRIKDQGTLIDAVARLVERSPGARAAVRLLIVGDGPERADLARRADARAIADLVHFAGARHDVAEWLRAMQVFVLPSLNEGISNTLLEAMASGLPTLATAVGGNMELVVDGHGGGLFSPGDAEALARRLEAYLLDPALLARDARAARARALTHFDLDGMVLRYGDLYQQLLGRDPGAPSIEVAIASMRHKPAPAPEDASDRSFTIANGHFPRTPTG